MSIFWFITSHCGLRPYWISPQITQVFTLLLDSAAPIRNRETSLRHTMSLILSLDVTRKKWPLIYQWGRRLLDLSLIDAVSLFSMHQISCHHFKWHVHCVGALVHTYNLAVSVCIVALPTRPSLKSTTMGWFNGKYEPLLGDIFYHTSFRRFEEEIEKKKLGVTYKFFVFTRKKDGHLGKTLSYSIIIELLANDFEKKVKLYKSSIYWLDSLMSWNNVLKIGLILSRTTTFTLIWR